MLTVDRKTGRKGHVGKSRLRRENKINLHQEIYKGKAWNGFKRHRVRTDEGVL